MKTPAAVTIFSDSPSANASIYRGCKTGLYCNEGVDFQKL